jgi:hypothetical protein
MRSHCWRHVGSTDWKLWMTTLHAGSRGDRAPRKPTTSTPNPWVSGSGLTRHLFGSSCWASTPLNLFHCHDNKRNWGNIYQPLKWGDLRAFHVRSSCLISTLPPFSMYAKHGEEHVASVVQITKQKLWSGIKPFVTYGKQTQDLLFILAQPLRPYEGEERGAVGRKRWSDSHRRGMGEDENIWSTIYLATFLNPRRVTVRVAPGWNQKEEMTQTSHYCCLCYTNSSFYPSFA